MPRYFHADEIHPSGSQRAEHGDFAKVASAAFGESGILRQKRFPSRTVRDYRVYWMPLSQRDNEYMVSTSKDMTAPGAISAGQPPAASISMKNDGSL